MSFAQCATRNLKRDVSRPVFKRALVAYPWVRADLDLSLCGAAPAQRPENRTGSGEFAGDRFGVWEPPMASFPVKAAARPAPLACSLRPCG